MSASEAAVEVQEGTPTEIDERSIGVVRLGHGANCSSMGSVIDTLFASAVIGGAIFAAIAATLKTEEVKVVGRPEAAPPPKEARPPE